MGSPRPSSSPVQTTEESAARPRPEWRWREKPTEPLSGIHWLVSGMKVTNGRGCEEPVRRRAHEVTLGQRGPSHSEIGDLGPGSTRDELVPRLRLQEPPSLTSGRGREVQPKVSTEMRQASPWVLGGARKTEQQAFVSWEGARGQCGEAWSRLLCPSGLPQSHRVNLQGSGRP